MCLTEYCRYFQVIILNVKSKTKNVTLLEKTYLSVKKHTFYIPVDTKNYMVNFDAYFNLVENPV